jgi:hypothetical protein
VTAAISQESSVCVCCQRALPDEGCDLEIVETRNMSSFKRRPDGRILGTVSQKVKNYIKYPRCRECQLFHVNLNEKAGDARPVWVRGTIDVLVAIPVLVTNLCLLFGVFCCNLDKTPEGGEWLGRNIIGMAVVMFIIAALIHVLARQIAIRQLCVGAMILHPSTILRACKSKHNRSWGENVIGVGYSVRKDTEFRMKMSRYNTSGEEGSSAGDA